MGEAGKHTGGLSSLGTESKCLYAYVHLCMCMHVCRWKRESGGKAFTGDSNITEKKIRNTYLWYQKRGLKYSH